MNNSEIEKATASILKAIGDDPERSSVKETPKRVAKAFNEIFAHTNDQQFNDFKLFDIDDDDQTVVVRNIPFYSMCEHHLLPFFGTVDVAYVPNNGKIIGLSKIPRLVDFVAKRPNVQENMTSMLITEMNRILNPKGVAVKITARHMCMEMRGINKQGEETTTTKFQGIFKSDSIMRSEFLN
ncbi:GTP cyclohydrolase I FolE [Pediococcus claussenii]|uniref:GTP cyclohydrolase 1 n=1 Tax=Pediococcus claussenii (strain ATCC BAA-344 / DSM 14800 / JCM 18046 / KCTC 3811 / LMG 21948 / P06) TaxID=701521 RepID=G8PDL5_PEDCP|nr:GTP cyclohydrolase I FolE [Pediococcus claussenii]AEV95350.1 GTP cyclohydrolase I [Pediococcus claussenii ATCC BAA-344]KRN18993.1 folE protein [Pediococcus claussenii]